MAPERTRPIERRRPVRDRLVTGGLRAGVALLRALPAGLVLRGAYAAGVGLSLVARGRSRLVGANLRRVLDGLAEAGLASPAVQAARRDERRFARMVRSAFGHWAQSYAESALVPAFDAGQLRGRVTIPDDPDAAAAMAPIGDGPGRIFIGLHFGSVELAALYGARVRGLRMMAPMETVADPALQGYFESARRATGIDIIPIRGAASRLRGALGSGVSAALVADRPIGGSGMLVPLFGHPARLPLGPAVLALESGAPCFVVGVRRTGWGRWAARVERLEPATGATLRERLAAHLAAQARAFERQVAEAPDQWWTLLFPIWKAT